MWSFSRAVRTAYDIQVVVMGGPGNGSKEEGKDQELMQSSTKPDPGHHMGK